MLMLMDDDLLSADIDPECAGVAPAHAVKPMESVVYLDHVRSFDLASVSVCSASVVAGEWAVDDGCFGVDVVKVLHEFISS